MINQEISKILYELAELLEIKGVTFKSRKITHKIVAYRKAARTLEELEEDVSLVYKKNGIKGLEKIPSIGKSIAEKIEEYLKKGKIDYYKRLKQETAIRQIITHYFKTKELSLNELKRSAKKRKIIYSRFTRPAKQLLELAGSIEKAKEAIDKVSLWAKSRDLDYAIETVFKKWLELDRLKPKKVVKKRFYQGNPMVWSQTHRKWYVIDENDEWLEFAGKESDVEWRIIK